MAKAKAYVYQLTHRETKQFYFGSRVANVLPSVEDLPLYQSSSKLVKDLGFMNFDYKILKEFESGDEAYLYEHELIKANFQDPLILNQHWRIGKDSGFKRSGPHTNETKKRISSSKAGVVLGPQTKEHRESISRGLKGIKFGPMAEERKKKISIAQKGKPRMPLTEYQKLCVSKAQSGKILSEETKSKLKRQVDCPHCGKTGGFTAMKCHHFENCKSKIS